MNNNEFLPQEEVDKIEKTKIDYDMLKRAKSRQQNTFHKILMTDLLNFLKGKLNDDENIDSYFSGRDYSSDSTRLIFSTFLHEVSHPIFGWSSNCILVITNKRLVLVEVTGYLQYANHYEVKKDIHLYKEKQYFYLTFEDISGKNKIVQYSINRLDQISEILNNIANIIFHKKLKSKSKKIQNSIFIIELAFLLWILYLMFINWSIIVNIS